MEFGNKNQPTTSFFFQLSPLMSSTCKAQVLGHCDSHCTLHVAGFTHGTRNPNSNKWELIHLHLHELTCTGNSQRSLKRVHHGTISILLWETFACFFHLTGWWLRSSTNTRHRLEAFSNRRSGAVDKLLIVKWIQARQIGARQRKHSNQPQATEVVPEVCHSRRFSHLAAFRVWSLCVSEWTETQLDSVRMNDKVWSLVDLLTSLSKASMTFYLRACMEIPHTF